MRTLSYLLMGSWALVVSAQNVGIGTNNPHPKAILHLEDSTRGFLLPRMTTAQRDTMTNVPEGLVIYNVTTHCLEVWNGTKWLSLCDNADTSCNAFTCSVSDSWSTLATPPLPARNNQVAIAYNGKIYVGFGDWGGTVFKDWWEYDVCTQTWTRKADFPGVARTLPFVFEINGKIYVGGGHGPNWTTFYSDVYAYDPTTDTWSAVAPLPSARGGAPGTSDGQYGYIFGGRSNLGDLDEVLRYDPNTDTWSLIANYPAGGRWIGIIAYMNNALYMGTGNNAGTYFSEFYKYDLTTNTWTNLAPHPHVMYDGWAIEVPSLNRIYVFGEHTSNSSYCVSQFYYYDIATNTWNPIAVFPGGNRNNLIGDFYNGVIYLGLGHNCSTPIVDWWAYCP